MTQDAERPGPAMDPAAPTQHENAPHPTADEHDESSHDLGPTASAAHFFERIGRTPGDRISACIGRDFDPSNIYRTTVAEVTELAVRYAGTDAYHSVGLLRPDLEKGRGKASDVVGITCLWHDFDVDYTLTSGTVGKAGALPSFEAARAAIRDLSAQINADPAAIVNTGHGYQVYWLLEERHEFGAGSDESDRVRRIVARFGVLCAQVCKIHGATDADNVAEIARVLRIPGTTNTKDPDDPRPVVAHLPTNYGTVSLDDLEETLPEPPTVPGKTSASVTSSEIADAPATVKDRLKAWEASAGAAHDQDVRRLARAEEDEPVRIGNESGTWEESHKDDGSRGAGMTASAAARSLQLDDTRVSLGLEPTHAAHYVAEFAKVGRKVMAEGKLRDNRQFATERGPAVFDGWAAALAAERLASNAPATCHPSRTAKALTLFEAHDVFTKWLGADYDLDALDAVLAAAAVERLDGDPLWLLVISGSGNAKTETVQALAGTGATMASTISSEGALLSATSKKERTSSATGGLLRQIGSRGVIVVKDVTSILSMQRDQRAQVLGALREVYDGRWTRTVGTDGGQTLEWAGRLVLVGAVTTAWDKAHAVIASMGDRFVLVRMDSTKGRQAAGRRAIGNTGHEEQMRAELAEAAAGVIAGMNLEPIEVTEDEAEALLAAADLVTLARTGVEYDYRGDVVDAHAPEMPTRFAKQLTQVVRGAVAIGLDRPDALRLAIRCARDSMPPLRLAIVDDLVQHPDSTTADVRKRLGLPRATVDRQLQALHMLGVVEVEEEEHVWRGEPSTRWRYRISPDVDPHALDAGQISARNVSTPPHPPVKRAKEEGPQATPRTLTDISGTGSAATAPALGGEPGPVPRTVAGRAAHVDLESGTVAYDDERAAS